MDKKGSKLISVYWFAILFIVAAAIAYMAYVFYGQPYDAREVEADILIDKIADCISAGGKLNENWEELNKDNLLEVCNLNFNVEDFSDWKMQEQYYSEVNYYNFDIDEGIIPESKKLKSSAGNSGMESLCNTGENMPKCLEEKFYVLGNLGEKYVIEIKSVVGKVDKNA
jgi:hypothetical protein